MSTDASTGTECLLCNFNWAEDELDSALNEVPAADAVELAHHAENAVRELGHSKENINGKTGDNLNAQDNRFTLGIVKAELPVVLCIIVAEADKVRGPG